MRAPPRRILALGGLAVVALLVLSVGLGAPRLTLSNDAMAVGYPFHQPLVLVAAAAALTVAALAWRGRAAIGFGALALLLAAGGAERWTYELEAGGHGLRLRSLRGRSALAWDDVSRVELAGDRIVVSGAGHARIEIGTRSLSSAQRASLERTISRRVYEASRAARGRREARPPEQAGPGERLTAEPRPTP